MLIILPSKDPRVRVPRRLNRDYPAKEEKEAGPMREEANQENEVSEKPK